MPVWSMRAPANDTVLLWQVSQAAVVTMCVVGLPVAVRPLWQVAQPEVMPVWSMRAPANDTVLLWQVSQAAVVTTASSACRWPSCRCGSWRSPVMPVWSMRAPANETVLLWQVSQAAVVTTCVVGLPVAVRAVVAGGAARVMPVWSMRGAGERDGALVAGLAGRGRDDVGRRLALRRACRCGRWRSPT